MRNVDLNFIERELKKRWSLNYEWGRTQNDVWDRHSNFIYTTVFWEDVTKMAVEVSTKRSLDKAGFLNYSSNRWYNFWSAMAVEKIFAGIEGVLPNVDQKNRLKDFNFFGIDFDHKTSVFPRSCGFRLNYALEHQRKLIEWLYTNQSMQQRRHYGNRLFLIVFSSEGEHWKIKAEISFLKDLIENYVATFELSQLKQLEFQPGESVFSDIIWAIK